MASHRHVGYFQLEMVVTNKRIGNMQLNRWYLNDRGQLYCYIAPILR